MIPSIAVVCDPCIDHDFYHEYVKFFDVLRSWTVHRTVVWFLEGHWWSDVRKEVARPPGRSKATAWWPQPRAVHGCDFGCVVWIIQPTVRARARTRVPIRPGGGPSYGVPAKGGPNGIEHAGPLGSLDLSGAGDPAVDFIPTGAAPQAGVAGKQSKDTAGEKKFIANGPLSLMNEVEQKKKEIVVVKKEKMVVKKKQEAGSSVAPAKSKSETNSDEDRRPLAKLVAAKTGGDGAKCRLVIAPSDSESTVSLPLLDINKRKRTKMPKLVKPIRAVEEQAFSKEISIVVRTEPENNYLHNSLWKWDAMSLKMSSYDEWAWLRNEVRMHTITSMTPISSMAKVEDELMTWAETELVSEFLKRWMFVQCKLYEKELKDKVDEHRDNLDTAEPSANYDHMCIQFLDGELKEMIKQHRSQRHQAELKMVKQVIKSLESKVDMVRDNQTYMKHDSDIFGRAFNRMMDEVVTSINTSQTALETNLVHQFTESQQQIASDLDFFRLHLAEFVMLATMSDPDPVSRGHNGSPRPETRLLRQPALEGLTNLARTESPRHADRNKSDHEVTGGGAWRPTAARLMKRRGGGYRD
ncbi:sporulation-specific protein 15-like [Dorcoceras hygrometricum]|uniref:Sporulation-specific protein 15-like n=1 Tax=Dorcoceras hygrometricum TaxID=472368 RepID=A0A2Z7BBD6_9LAMI|nr:sporulation-specific protein 15-like [Dorcoceras hygrometricum]